MYNYFDIDKLVRQSGLPDRIIERIKKETRRDFPVDDLLYELHLMRVIKEESAEYKYPRKSEEPSD